MTDLAKTPIHEWHVANSGRMVEFAGWSMPVQYTSIVTEHTATRTGIGLFDISHMGRLRFEGPDAATFLDRLLTRAVHPIPPRGIRYGLVANSEGGIRDDVLVYRLRDESGEFHLLVVNASNRSKILDWINAQRSDAESFSLRDLTEVTAMFAVQGPQAVALGDAFCQPRVSEMDYYQGACGVCTADGREIDATISRTGYTGEDGFEIIVSADDALAVWQELLSQGHTQGITPAGLGARDTLRLEAGMPLYGHELDEDINPLEAGLRFAVQFKDRSFIGSQAIAAVKADGPTRKRIGLTLQGRRAPREGYPVLEGDGRVVGTVTSGTFSPTLEKPIAMAYVEADADLNSLSVDIRGKIEPATVADLPFYKRK